MKQDSEVQRAPREPLEPEELCPTCDGPVVVTYPTVGEPIYKSKSAALPRAPEPDCQTLVDDLNYTYGRVRDTDYQVTLGDLQRWVDYLAARAGAEAPVRECLNSPTGKHALSAHEGARTKSGGGKACVWCGKHESELVRAGAEAPPPEEP
jgi:hypothetical protein